MRCSNKPPPTGEPCRREAPIPSFTLSSNPKCGHYNGTKKIHTDGSDQHRSQDNNMWTACIRLVPIMLHVNQPEQIREHGTPEKIPHELATQQLLFFIGHITITLKGPIYAHLLK